MPSCGFDKVNVKRTWATMERWQRKQFYRNNESRIRNGLQALSKP